MTFKSVSKLTRLVGAFALASLLFTGNASAAVYTSLGTCAVTDMTVAADACFGAVQPEPINDSESELNNNFYGTDDGLFGYKDWDFLAKEDTPGGLSGTDIGLSVTPSGGAASGDWSVNAGALDSFARLVFILKAGNTFSAYLYEPGSDAGSSGSWLTSALDDKDLSHLSIYTSGMSPVPVPAAIWLFGTALLGFIGVSRRTKV